jgi:tetratricopeptide (TPR) repeat protein
MSEDRILQEAISAIKKGQRARARDLITRLLRQDQTRVDYWLYMSSVVETRKERIACLENVLKYDPENETALHGLVMLGARAPDDARLPVRPENEREWEKAEIYGMDGAGVDKRTFTRIPAAQVIALVLVAVIGAGLIFVGVFGNPFYSGSQSTGTSGEPTNTLRPLVAAGPTATTRPSATPLGGVPTLDASKPTALSIRLEETYTPTPLYVNTPHPNNEAFAAGLRSLNSGDYALALALLEDALENITDPAESDVDIRYYIALAKMGVEDFRDAKRDFDLILLEAPRFAPAYLGRAQAQLAMNPDAVVAVDLYKSIELESEYKEGYLAIADYRLNRGMPDVAVEIMDDLLEFAPDNPRGHYYRAISLLALGEYEDALDAAQRAFELDMLMVDNYYALGTALVENDSGQVGYGYLDLYLRHDEHTSDPMALYMLGRAYQAFDNHEAAIDYFESAYAIRRDIYEMSYYWAKSLVALEEYEKALERVRVPIQRIPDWFEPYVVQAQAYYYLDELEDARTSIAEGAVRAETEIQLAHSYYWQAVIYGEMGFVVVARNNWEELTALDPEIVPPEYLEEAEVQLETALPTATSSESTPTRVPTSTVTVTPTP